MGTPLRHLPIAPRRQLVLVNTPEGKYWEFFRADRAKDPSAWSAVMSYPHVRVAGSGRTELFQTADEYASSASWVEREATDWVRTEGIEPTRLHASDDKVLLAGGWTRYNADDKPILQNRVVYVLTQIYGQWGIQARFACGAAPVWQTTDDKEPCDIVEKYLESFHQRDFMACSRLVNFPLTCVGVGAVQWLEDEPSLTRMLAASRACECGAHDTQIIQNGSSGANVAISSFRDSDQKSLSLFLVSRDRGSCHIVAMTHM